MGLTGCGAGMSDSQVNSIDNGDASKLPIPLKPTQKDMMASRFLGHAAWGGNTAEIQRVLNVGLENWLAQQMSQPIQQSFVQWLIDRGYGQKGNSSTQGLYPGLWCRLMTSPDLVRQRIALALSEFFVCSVDKLITGGYGQFAVAGYWEVLEKNAFGNFSQLLEDVTINPMMGFYLNTKGNTKASAGRVPDQNYAREVMQLFTIGLHELNQDGTEKKNAQGNVIETYTNTDIEGLSKVFTGWNLNNSFKTSDTDPFWQYAQSLANPMVLNEHLHSPEEKTFLGTSIAPNTAGKESLRLALNVLFHHANTGPFFAKQMIQRLVTSNPSPAYVERVANVFANNGQGIRGDLKAVFKAILLDPQAREFDIGGGDNSFGKLREPMVRFIQWGRTFAVTSASNKINEEWVFFGPTLPTEDQLGQMPMFAPSVFNFFRPSYSPPNSVLGEQNLLAPEFQILTEPSIIGYVNFMQHMISNDIKNKPVGQLQANYDSYIYLAVNPKQLVETLTLHIAPGAFSEAKKTALTQLLTRMGNDPESLKQRVYTAVWLVMCAPDYLVQR